MFTDSTAVIKSVIPAFKSVWPDDDYYNMCMRRTSGKKVLKHIPSKVFMKTLDSDQSTDFFRY